MKIHSLCRDCKNLVLIDPFTGSVNSHFLQRGFMDDYTPGADGEGADNNGEEPVDRGAYIDI